jgi:multidrug efflux pump subunit AcrA (membrane-fusion protein)
VAKSLSALFVLIPIFLLVTPWQQTIYGTGVVIAYSPGERQQVISAPITGVVDEWFVNEGSPVKAGQQIVLLKDQDPKFMYHLEAEKKAIEMQIKVMKQASAVSLLNVNRQKKLFEKGISSKRKFELAKLEYARYVSDIAKSTVELAKIKVRISRQKSQLVLAPQDGTIIRRLTGGDSVIIKQGDVLAELVPNTKSRAVELWIDGNDTPLVNVGDKVTLQFEGWPAIQLSGWPSLAINTFRGEIRVIDPAADKRGFFRLLIMPEENGAWPNLRFLRQGVQVHGWVQLGRVRLGYELWRRFNGFPETPSHPIKYQ